jgi:uncharacterized protein YjaZ
MLEIIQHLDDTAAESRSIELIDAAYREVRELIPELPENLKIYFDNWYLITETGEGGFAYSPDILTMAFASNFTNTKLQAAHVRSTVFHESYHLAHGHTYEQSTLPYRHALDSAIYEGCASVFEREYTQPDLLPGDYSACSESQLQEWRDALANISNDDYKNGDTGLWVKWALYDKEANERWRVYKVGTWLVDRALQNSGGDILDFRKLTAEQILNLL